MSRPSLKTRGLGPRVDPVRLQVGEDPFAPFERVARIVAHAVEQLAEVQVEVAQERIKADHVGQRHAQVAPILARPGVEGGGLRVAQARTQRLERLQPFVRHRPLRHQPVLAGEVHVRGTDEMLAQFGAQVRQHLALPVVGIAAARAEIGDHAAVEAHRVAQPGGLGAQPAQPPSRSGGP